MKILHIITRLDFGGSSENVLLSAKGSRDAGREVLVATGPSTELSDYARETQTPIVVLEDLVRSVHPWRDLRAFFQILRLLRDCRPDIVHTHSSKAGILGRWAAWVYRGLAKPKTAPSPRIIHTPHGHVFYGYFGPYKSALFLMIERLSASVTDRWVALSEGEKRESLERGLGSPEKWTVIPSGVRLESSKPLTKQEAMARLKISLPDSAAVVGCIARLDPIKGINVLVEAAAKVKAERAGANAAFLIFGEGAERIPLEKRIRELGLEKTVILAGYHADPGSFLGAMDIYAQPSINEGMGKTLVMAHSAGLPVVASKVCGIPDVVREGESGILVPASDPRALADGILRLLQDENLRGKMGQKGKEWVLSADETGFPRFSAEAMIRRLEDLYG